MNLNDLIIQLSQPHLRTRSGIWLVPAQWVGQEAEYLMTISSHTDCVDLRVMAIRNRPEGASSAGISPERIMQWIDEAIDQEGVSGCIVILHLDLFLARLSGGDRAQVMNSLRNLPHRSRGLIISLPVTVKGTLIDARDFEPWRINQRLVEN